MVNSLVRWSVAWKKKDWKIRDKEVWGICTKMEVETKFYFVCRVTPVEEVGDNQADRMTQPDSQLDSVS